MSMSSSAVRVGSQIRSRAGYGATRLRKPAFYALTVAFLGFLLLALGDTLTMVVNAWTGGYAFPGHRVHHIMIGGTLAIFVASIAVQLYRPRLRVGALAAALVFVIAGFVLTAVASGLVAASEMLVFLVPVVAIAFLHPAREELIPRLERADRRTLAVAGIGVLGFGALAVTEFVNHTTLGDEHALFGHYEFMLLALVVIGLFGLLGGLKFVGWRFPLYAASALALLYAGSSIVFPGAEQGSSLGTIGAFAVILWAVALVAVSASTAREDSSESDDDETVAT